MKTTRTSKETRRRTFWRGFSSVFTPPEVLAMRQRPARFPEVGRRISIDPWERVHKLLRDASQTVMGEHPCRTSR